MSEILRIKLPERLKGVRVRSVHGPGTGVLPTFGGAGPGAGETDFEDLHEAAFQEGFKAAASEWKSRLAHTLRRLDEEAVRLSECREVFFAQLEQSVVDLGLAVAEMVLISERERKRYSINAVVQSLLEKVDVKGGPITIALNPGDMGALSSEGVAVQDGKYASIRLKEDPEVPPAGCRLETGAGTVAVSLEGQMKEFRRLLTGMEVPEYDGRGD